MAGKGIAVQKICTLSLILFALIFPARWAQAGLVVIPDLSGSGTYVQVISQKESLFQTTVHQKYDFSCGSAALATLLTYHYDTPVTEQDVFTWMFEKGDKEKIRREGFSLLDMKNYLEDKGFRADGFYVPLDKLAAVGVPAIVLINLKGYRHFVVVKGVTDKRVLIGDPATGIKVISRDDFGKMWNGLVFIIRNRIFVADKNFNRLDEWMTKAKAPIGLALQAKDLASITFLLPRPGGAGP